MRRLLGGIDPLDASVEQLQQLEQLVGLLGVDLSAGAVGIGPGVWGGSGSRLRENVVPLGGSSVLSCYNEALVWFSWFLWFSCEVFPFVFIR